MSQVATQETRQAIDEGPHFFFGANGDAQALGQFIAGHVPDDDPFPLEECIGGFGTVDRIIDETD